MDSTLLMKEHRNFMLTSLLFTCGYFEMAVVDLIQYLAWICSVMIVCLFLRVLFLFTRKFDNLTHSRLYFGRVTHTRLKGGAVHHLNYPIFFAYLDLKEIQSIGWSLWPIFKLNSPFSTFASFDDKQHLKDYQSQVGHHKHSFNQAQHVAQLQASDPSLTFDRIGLLTHLTYFGYCFNPISVYYLFKSQPSPTNCEETTEALDTVIAEVSNTPWIEMHTYVLREGITGVQSIQKDACIQGTQMFQAIWKKCFHVSPFMEMDYMYDFAFSSPSLTSATQMIPLQVRSKMIKESTKEVWFTANFDVTALAFTPRNLLYVLIFYPMQTRLIQVFIHWEALKLFWKGVPTFEHPEGTDVDFGYGITGQRLGTVLWFLIAPFYKIVSWVTAGVSGSASIGIARDNSKKKVL